jgi:hypothetical protein
VVNNVPPPTLCLARGVKKGNHEKLTVEPQNITLHQIIKDNCIYVVLRSYSRAKEICYLIHFKFTQPCNSLFNPKYPDFKTTDDTWGADTEVSCSSWKVWKFAEISEMVQAYIQNVGQQYTNRASDRRLSEKLVPIFAEIRCHMFSVTNPYYRLFDFLV